MYDIEYYPSEDNALILDLINEMEGSKKGTDYGNIMLYIEKLSEHGFKMNSKFKRESYKKIDDNLFELRPPKIRIFFTCFNNKFYILQGFYKKTPKLPPNEINKAKRYINDIKKGQIK
ncbi:MAG: hypothetical protein GX931_04130 [Acholeplasmataceae bacterium]|jgi:phage-related protein|nr:hypothetical protein [Acholeplasmataceae bacterium]